MTYLEWNDAFAAHFFKPEASGKPVHLYVNTELIPAAHEGPGAGLADFVVAVKIGPPWATRQGICQKALQAFSGWRRRGLAFPPYIGYLGLFVLAAGAEGDWAPHAYYPRLWQLLGESRAGMLPSFEMIDELWEDLERWSMVDKSGELGVFRARSAGNWIHVGYPIAQTILTEHERKELPLIFAAANLDPTAPPSEVHLARVLREHGEHLRRRTQELLRSRQDEEALAALIQAVDQELVDWDGVIPDEVTAPDHRRDSIYGALRICLRVNKVAGVVNATFRCKLNREYPAGELTLVGAPQNVTLICEEDIGGWSSQLQVAEQGSPIDASSFDWRHVLNLREASLGWQLRLPAGEVRVMVNGDQEGLPGLIEIHRLPQNRPFYILFHETAWNRLQAWSENDCSNFTQIQVTSGLPTGWRLVQVAAATSDQRVRDSFPVLSFAQELHINLRGGLRSFGGNSYFAFAPPDVVIDGGDGTEKVFCNGEAIASLGQDHVYALPAKLPRDSRIVVEAQCRDSVRSQSLYLTSDMPWVLRTPVRHFDKWGESVDPEVADAPVVCGAAVNPVAETTPFVRSLVLSKGFPNRKLILLGKHPGQVTTWPAEGEPTNWQPVWGVNPRRGRRVVYCAEDIESAGPSTDPLTADKQSIRRWKEILWHHRKRVIPPKEAIVNLLWKQYQEAARDV